MTNIANDLRITTHFFYYIFFLKFQIFLVQQQLYFAILLYLSSSMLHKQKHTLDLAKYINDPDLQSTIHQVDLKAY